MLNLRRCVGGLVTVLLMSGVTGACSGGLERFSGPCWSGQELREERYDSASIKARGCVGPDSENNYRRQGHWEYFYPNGQKSGEGSYVDGFQGGETGETGILIDGREGAWMFWHENGQKSREDTYLNGTITSITEWDANGTQTTPRGFTWDMLETRDANGTQTTPGGFSSPCPSGQELREELYDATSIQSRGCFRTDSENSFPTDGREGAWMFWHENGQKWREETYRDGKREGLTTAWYENGQQSMDGTYRDGKDEGLFTEWHENGQKSRESTFRDGVLEGPSTSWYPNGQKWSETTWRDGQREGHRATWHDNGQKSAEWTIRDGSITSVTEWDANGTQTSR